MSIFFHFFFRRARTHCDLFILTKEALDLVLESYPEIKDKITLRAKNETKRAKRMSQVVRDMQDERRSSASEGTNVVRVGGRVNGE